MATHFTKLLESCDFMAHGGSSIKADDHATPLSGAQITSVSDSPIDIVCVSRVESVNESRVESTDVPRVGSVDVSTQEDSVDPDYHQYSIGDLVKIELPIPPITVCMTSRGSLIVAVIKFLHEKAAYNIEGYRYINGIIVQEELNELGVFKEL